MNIKTLFYLFVLFLSSALVRADSISTPSFKDIIRTADYIAVATFRQETKKDNITSLFFDIRETIKGVNTKKIQIKFNSKAKRYDTCQYLEELSECEYIARFEPSNFVVRGQYLILGSYETVKINTVKKQAQQGALKLYVNSQFGGVYQIIPKRETSWLKIIVSGGQGPLIPNIFFECFEPICDELAVHRKDIIKLNSASFSRMRKIVNDAPQLAQALGAKLDQNTLYQWDEVAHLIQNSLEFKPIMEKCESNEIEIPYYGGLKCTELN